MSWTNQDVVRRFIAGKKRCFSSSRHLYFEDNILYSYGRHFPLMIRLPAKNYPKIKTKNKNYLFILNGDRYSTSTTAHQSFGNRMADVTVSLSAFPFSLFEGLDGKYRHGTVKIIDIVNDSRKERCFNIQDAISMAHAEEIVLDLTNGEMGYTCSISAHDDMIAGDGSQGVLKEIYVHRPGGMAVRYNRYVYVSSMDEGSYFVSKLPYHAKVHTFGDAISALQPPELLQLEMGERNKVIRQGEWFFMPRPDIETNNLPQPTQKMIDLAKAMGVENSGNLHIARDVRVNGAVYARGTVSHKNRWNNKATGQHPRVNLKEVWHEVWLNQALESWSASGDVD